MVTHPGTNRARRALTSFMRRTPLTHRHTASNITHTHPFNGLLSGTTRVSRYQKGKTNLDFTEARDSEWQWHQVGHMQVCTSFQIDNHTSTPPLKVFCRPDALPVAQPTASKHSIIVCNELLNSTHPARCQWQRDAAAAAADYNLEIRCQRSERGTFHPWRHLVPAVNISIVNTQINR